MGWVVRTFTFLLVAVCLSARGQTNGAAGKSVGVLLLDLKSKDGRTVYEAFRRLGAMGAQAETAAPELVKLLGDANAAFVVTNFRSPANIVGPSQRFGYADEARHALTGIGPTAAPELLAGLKEDSPGLQRNCALVLGALAGDTNRTSRATSAQIAQALSVYLQQHAGELSVDDLGAVGRGKSPEVAQELILRLQSDTNYEVRAWAALTLGRLQAAEGIAPLKKALASDRNNLVRQFSAKALGEFNRPDQTTGALSQALSKDTDSGVRAQCAESLREARSEEAVAALTEALGDSWHDVRLNAAVAFWTTKSQEAVPALIAALAKEDEYLTRDFILTALARQKAVAALPEIQKILDDPSKKLNHDHAQFAKDVITGKREWPENNN